MDKMTDTFKAEFSNGMKVWYDDECLYFDPVEAKGDMPIYSIKIPKGFKPQFVNEYGGDVIEFKKHIRK